MSKNILRTLIAFTGAVAVAGCLGSSPSGSGGQNPAPSTPAPTQPGASNPAAPSSPDPTQTTTPSQPQPSAPAQPAAPDPAAALAQRVIDYGQALRTAALKLTGELPTIDEQVAVVDATSYAAQIDKYLADPRLPRQLLSYFQDMMKLGGPASTTQGSMHPSFDTAPTFAAEIVVNDRPFTDLFTAATNTCPTLDPTTGAFTDASCATANGLTTVGVLTDPGAMSQFYSNMAFRRVRWVQETFVCSKFPAEYTSTPVAKGNGQYVSPWPFDSITGGTGAPVDFQDTSSVVCANCHTTMNHIAPLFASFDMQGAYQTTIQVKTPVLMTPTTKLSDWLPSGQVTSWRFNQPVADLTALGAAMAKDPAVATCQVQRAWNWLLSKDDIVDDLATVPQSTIDAFATAFVSGGYKLKPVLKAMLTSDDFVKF